MLLLVTVNDTVWLDSLGPSLMDVAQATDVGPSFSGTDWFEPLLKLGASLTAVTVIVNVSVVESPSGPPRSR